MRKKPLSAILADSRRLANLTLNEWDRLLPWARLTGVVGRVYSQFENLGLLQSIPKQVLPHLEATAIIAAEHERMIRWEVNQIQRALIDTSIPITLLKGAAYVMATLPCARGRLVSDVDILVPKAQLLQVESALKARGWQAVKLDEYDQQYYRQWMHELPPLRHRQRGTVVDVHHTILPESSRLTPDPVKLLADAVPLENSQLRVLAPEDMVLHSAVHAFHDGELSNSLRDLLDLHELLCHFGAEPFFWQRLPDRARQLGLERPLFYALRYSRRFLNTSVPATVLKRVSGPAPPVCWVMDALMDSTVITESPRRRQATVARRLLYARSHWLRMPPLLLTKHLLHKARVRWQARASQANQKVG